MSAIYKEGVWYGGAADAEDISIKIGQNNLVLAETVQNIVKDLAPIETNSTNATTSYKTGDLLTHNGVLYRVINNITAGDPLIEGINITETTITQGVDLTNRVVALENKTQKISQISNNDENYLQVNDKGLKINNLFLAGQNGATTALNNTVGLLLRKPERSIDVYINEDNTAGIYDRGNTKWILRSNDEGTEIKTDASTFVCGSTATTGKFKFRAANNFHAVDLLASDSGRCGVLDAVPDKWLIFLEAAASTNQPNTIKTSYPFYLNSTTVANLTSRGTIKTLDGYNVESSRHLMAGTDNSELENVCRVTNKYRSLQFTPGTSAGQAGIWELNTGRKWMIYSTTTGNVYIPRGILGVGGADITTSVAVSVKNTRRNISLHVDSNAGIWDADDNGGKGKWLISSNNTTGTRTVDIPHPLTTGNLSAGNTTVTGLTNTGDSVLKGTTVTSLTNTGNTSLKGTTATSLTVNGNANINGILKAGNTIMGTDHNHQVIVTGNSNTSRIGIISGTTYGGGGLHMKGNFGTTAASTRDWALSGSDRRLKKNIKLTSKSGLNLINKLDVVEFDWKNNSGHWNYGIIAQDAAKIDKNIVVGEEKEDYYLSIDTLYLIDVLVKATQELSAQVTELKEKIKILEEKIN